MTVPGLGPCGLLSSARYAMRLAIAVAMLLSATVATAQEPKPNISQRFPIRERGNISPPIVDAPIHECAVVVSVSGFVPKAEIRVFANGGELIGTDRPRHDPAKLKLTRALVLSDSITATQTVGFDRSLARMS